MNNLNDATNGKKTEFPLKKEDGNPNELVFYKPHWRFGEFFSIGLFFVFAATLLGLALAGKLFLDASIIFIVALLVIAGVYFFVANFYRKRQGNMRAVLQDGELTVTGSRRKLDERNTVTLKDVREFTYNEEPGIFVFEATDKSRLYIPERIAAEKPLRMVIMEMMDRPDVRVSARAQEEINLYNQLDPM